jgi:hypothetical protein
MKRKLKAFALVAIILLSLCIENSGNAQGTNRPGVSFNTDQTGLANEALSVVEQYHRTVFAECTGTTGQTFLFTKIVASTAPSSGFAPPVVPRGGPAGGSSNSYYQVAIVPNQSGIKSASVPVTEADRRTGVDAKYQISFYTSSYRVFNMATGGWSPWTSGRPSFGGNKVYAFYTVERRDHQWIVVGFQYPIISAIGNAQAPNCSEVPRG